MPDPVQTTVSLPDRIEAALGPDAELNTDIAEAVGIHLGSLGRALPYTASVDAALSLLDGVGVLLHLGDITADGLPLAHVGDPSPGGGEGKGIARTLALSLCAAAIRCKESRR